MDAHTLQGFMDELGKLSSIRPTLTIGGKFMSKATAYAKGMITEGGRVRPKHLWKARPAGVDAPVAIRGLRHASRVRRLKQTKP